MSIPKLTLNFGLSKSDESSKSDSIQIFKYQSGKYLVLVEYWREKGRIYFKFGFNKDLMADIKVMSGAKYHGYDEENPRKLWSVLDNDHNNFQLDYFRSRFDKSVDNPYARYDAPLIDLEFKPRMNRWLGKEVLPYIHQQETTRFILTRRGCIIAEEMGIGKTWADILAMEYVKENLLPKIMENDPDGVGWRKRTYSDEQMFWYIAPKNVIRAIERELLIWDCQVRPRLMTYEGLVKEMNNWPSGQIAPFYVTLDEMSKCKSHTSQRSQAAESLANGVRSDWGDEGFVVGMTGTPAPKSPEDWYQLCRIVRPGFLKEGDIYKFKNRLAHIVQAKSAAGGAWPQLVAWKDDVNRCGKCGEFKEHVNHQTDGFGAMVALDPKVVHSFQPGINEVDLLYKRMKGLVLVKFKRDCLDLPEKRYELIELKPSPSLIRAAGLITKTSKTAIEALTRLRELSDGFQYEEIEAGEEKCGRCQGTKEAFDYREIPGSCIQCRELHLDDPINQCPGPHRPEIETLEVACDRCDVNGLVKRVVRNVKIVPCPKDDALDDDLDSLEEIGRITIFGGFTATIDRICKRCFAKGWNVIRVDQGKWQFLDSLGHIISGENDYLSIFQGSTEGTHSYREKYPKVAFVAHPGSGGMGLTLTASPLEVFYSNDFNGEYRTQAEDRGHRPGMSETRGLLIKDYIHLPSDRKVLDNLKGKRRLELMSLGDVSTWINQNGDRVT